MPPSRRARPEPQPVAAPPLDAALLDLARTVGLLGASTPIDAHLEHRRLLADFSAGRERLPAWRYAAPAPAHEERLQRLDDLEPQLRSIERTQLGRLYRARAEEIRLELLATRAVRTPSFAERAALRFAPGPERPEADALATEWSKGVPASAETLVVSDDRDPRSLASRLRAEVDRRKLPFAVRTSPSMSPLAAISGDTLWVAEGRPLSEADVARTVLHEIEAHALPRVRAQSLPIGLFAIGTAKGSDDQEGYALWLEETRGVSSVGRKKELGTRHVAVSLMRGGADFVAVVRALRQLDVPLEAALRVAQRAFRGSDGVAPGLGRESVYLDAYVRVTRWLSERPDDETVLGAGQVAVAAIGVLRSAAQPLT